jgi:hypothetical protein
MVDTRDIDDITATAALSGVAVCFSGPDPLNARLALRSGAGSPA